MPVKLQGCLPAVDEARIEIIPLIDIMFFLLASFMLVSLSMVNLKSVKVNLPGASSATADVKQNIVDVSVASSGKFYLDKTPVTDDELLAGLIAALKRNSDARVMLSGDADARHGDVVHALDLIRLAGIGKVALEIKP